VGDRPLKEIDKRWLRRSLVGCHICKGDRV